MLKHCSWSLVFAWQTTENPRQTTENPRQSTENPRQTTEFLKPTTALAKQTTAIPSRRDEKFRQNTSTPSEHFISTASKYIIYIFLVSVYRISTGHAINLSPLAEHFITLQLSTSFHNFFSPCLSYTSCFNKSNDARFKIYSN